MKVKEIKNRTKRFWNENKQAIITVGLLAGTVVGSVAMIAYQVKKAGTVDLSNVSADDFEYDIDFGRDCLITYTVQETGEVLWKDMCTEDYVEEMKNSGMGYEMIRKLNGLE